MGFSNDKEIIWPDVTVALWFLQTMAASASSFVCRIALDDPLRAVLDFPVTTD
jgi:hypothetical protein